MGRYGRKKKAAHLKKISELEQEVFVLKLDLEKQLRIIESHHAAFSSLRKTFGEDTALLPPRIRHLRAFEFPDEIRVGNSCGTYPGDFGVSVLKACRLAFQDNQGPLKSKLHMCLAFGLEKVLYVEFDKTGLMFETREFIRRMIEDRIEWIVDRLKEGIQ